MLDDDMPGTAQSSILAWIPLLLRDHPMASLDSPIATPFRSGDLWPREREILASRSLGPLSDSALLAFVLVRSDGLLNVFPYIFVLGPVDPNVYVSLIVKTR